MLSVLRRRFTGDSSEDPVEMGQGLEPNLKGNLADTVARVKQKVLRFLQPDAGNKVGVVCTIHHVNPEFNTMSGGAPVA